MNSSVAPQETQPSTILWRQVWGLTVLLAAHSFGWMVYNLFQPQLLQSLGFQQLALWLGVLQGFLAAIFEPGIGYLADGVLRRLGSRLPLITTGVTLAGLIFVVLALLLQVQLQSQLRWLVPLLMTIWVMAMVIFRGPVVALLKNTTPLQALPRANTALTVVFGLVGALEPLLEPRLQQMGASKTFMLGAITLVLAALVLYLNAPPQGIFIPQSNAVADFGVGILPRSKFPIPKLAGLLLTGLGAGLTANLLLRLLPSLVAAQQTGLSANLITSAILVIAALSAVPMENATRQLGTKRTLFFGVLGSSLLLLGFSLPLAPLWQIVLVLVAGLMFGLIFTSQIPFALETLPTQQAGLATGCLFGGIGMATALVSLAVLISPAANGFALVGGAGLTLCLTSLGMRLVTSRAVN
jgi:MFS family permease